MSRSNDVGWSWFEASLDMSDDLETGKDVAKKFARCFQGENGEDVLSYLAEMTMARPLAGNVEEGVLRHLEGQRYLVSYIISLVRQGRVGK